MKFYVASGFENKQQVRQAIAFMRAAGWELTHDWTGATDDIDRQKAACDEIDGVLNADVLLVLLPGGKGTFAEIGAALIQAIPVHVWASQLQQTMHSGDVFLNHPMVEVYVGCGLEDFLDWIIRKYADKEAE